MTFPDRKFADAASYADAYFAQVAAAAASVDRARIAAAANILAGIYRAGGSVYACGNGGSAAISNHLVCDHMKAVRSDTDLNPRIVSLSATVEIMTAIANDLSYDEVFVHQLSALARPGDALIAISGSGDSENIVRALGWAKENGHPTIAMTGFSGGRAAALADVNLHVTADNYGIIEDVHQSLMHILAQHLRQAHMDAAAVGQRTF